MFVFGTFEIKGRTCKLVLPQKNQAESLYKWIERDRKRLAKYLPWANSMLSSNDEEKFINYALEKMLKGEMFVLTIIVDNESVGMIDLHNISKIHKRAEIGYWLASEFEGYGIITETVKRLIIYSFNELELNKVYIYADCTNIKSKAVAERLNFIHEAQLKEHIYDNGKFRDFDVYSLRKRDSKF